MTTNPPAITLSPCESSQIVAFGYDPATQTLAIQFPGRGVKAGDTYHYAEVPPKVYQDMVDAESKGKFFGSQIRGRYAYAKQPDPETGIAFGLATAQEPKYTCATATGRLTVRATGKPIPDDEPVFVLRAQDVHAVNALLGYSVLLDNPEHRAAVEQRIKDFEAFRDANPDRMKFPDTAAA
ncbi:KTSC domain-containing protein [Hydrogenophaga sp.]|uniref:KTSC domain-containing protein n=1 Tax=Hydrogenophaga sp. TaxID=1904254 RepID=UPI0025C44928|nr:KTSC domain-containing protein [Hydrogenophaga sp.]